MHKLGVIALGVFLLPSWAEAGPELKELSTRHYTIRTDLPKKEARQLAGFVEAMHTSYTKTFKGKLLREGYAPRVRVFRDQADYNAYGGADEDVAFNTNWRGYFARDRAELVSYRGKSLPDLFAILSHEGLHQFMWGYGVPEGGERYPDWYEEGLGEWFRTGRTRGSQLVLGTLTYHVQRVQRAIREDWVWTLDQILDCDPSQLKDPDRFDAFYAHAYLLMDLLVTQEPKAVRRIYELKKEGKPNAEIVAEVLGGPEQRKRLYAAFLEHVKTKK